MSCVVFGNGFALLHCLSFNRAYCCDWNFVSN